MKLAFTVFEMVLAVLLIISPFANIEHHVLLLGLELIAYPSGSSRAILASSPSKRKRSAIGRQGRRLLPESRRLQIDFALPLIARSRYHEAESETHPKRSSRSFHAHHRSQHIAGTRAGALAGLRARNVHRRRDLVYHCAFPYRPDDDLQVELIAHGALMQKIDDRRGTVVTITSDGYSYFPMLKQEEEERKRRERRETRLVGTAALFAALSVVIGFLLGKFFA